MRLLGSDKNLGSSPEMETKSETVHVRRRHRNYPEREMEEGAIESITPKIDLASPGI